MFGSDDYLVISRNGTRYFFSLLPQRAEFAGTNLLLLLMTAAVVLGLGLSFIPHCTRTVSDPVRIMRRGLVKSSYKLEVWIPGEQPGMTSTAWPGSTMNGFCP
jgi:hypothetical protein